MPPRCARRSTAPSSARCRPRPRHTSTRPSPSPLARHEAADLPIHERAAILDRAAALLLERQEEFAQSISDRVGQADQDGTGRSGAGGRHLPVLGRRGSHPDRRDDPARSELGGHGQVRVRAAGADRCGRCDQPVQLPAQPGEPQGRAGHRRRVSGRVEAGVVDTADRAEARRPACSTTAACHLAG